MTRQITNVTSSGEEHLKSLKQVLNYSFPKEIKNETFKRIGNKIHVFEIEWNDLFLTSSCRSVTTAR